jgi:type I restriction enzyme M protein
LDASIVLSLRHSSEVPYVLTPARYVGAQQVDDDDEAFHSKMTLLAATLRLQAARASKLDESISANLKELGYGE